MLITSRAGQCWYRTWTIKIGILYHWLFCLNIELSVIYGRWCNAWFSSNITINHYNTTSKVHGSFSKNNDKHIIERIILQVGSSCWQAYLSSRYKCNRWIFQVCRKRLSQHVAYHLGRNGKNKFWYFLLIKVTFKAIHAEYCQVCWSRFQEQTQSETSYLIF